MAAPFYPPTVLAHPPLKSALCLSIGVQCLINRAAVILRYKEPAVVCVNEADPIPDSKPLSLEDLNEERTVYLVTDEDAEDERTFEAWLSTNYLALFETELDGWYTDESLWPSELTRELFDNWFTVELHTVLVDTVGGEIYDDET